jgi:carbon starvation protein
LTAFVPLLILLSAREGAWRQFWVLFGTSNQLLASLTLLGVSVWLYRSGRRIWYTVLPMLFVMTATVSALLVQMAEGAKEIADGGLRLHPSIVNGFVATALLILAIIFVIEGLRTVRDVRRGRGVQALATEPSAGD